jgi:5-hydroxyisourate hydrolase-like protein (transthyretin family)
MNPLRQTDVEGFSGMTGTYLKITFTAYDYYQSFRCKREFSIFLSFLDVRFRKHGGLLMQNEF